MKRLNIFKVIGVLFFILGILLILSKFERHYFDGKGNQVLPTAKNLYSTTDGIGHEIYFKNLDSYPNTTDIITAINLILGLLLIFYSNFFRDLFYSRISLLTLILCVTILFTIVYYLENNSPMLVWMYPLLALLLTVLISLFLFIPITGIYKLWKKKKELIILFILLSIFTITIYTEYGNLFSPFTHEGNFGQVDGNFITIFEPFVTRPVHAWLPGYIIFRVSNILLFIFSLIFVVRVRDFAKVNS